MGRLARHARINYMGEVPDGSARMYVPDLNGKLYPFLAYNSALSGVTLSDYEALESLASRAGRTFDVAPVSDPAPVSIVGTGCWIPDSGAG